VETLLHEMLASVHRSILCPVWVGLKRETQPFPHSHGLLHAFSFLLCFVSQLLSQGSVDVHMFLAEVTRAWETAAAAEAARAVEMLATETYAREVIAV
jgi:hypothetical protein